MTQSFEVETFYNISVEKCLKYMADPGLNEHLSSLPSLSHRRVTALKSEGTLREWSVEIGWGEALPAFVRHAVGEGRLHWIQSFRMDMESLKMTFRVDHPFPASALDVSGEGWIVPIDASSCRVVLKVDITSRLALFGARLERLIARRAAETMREDAALRLDYIRQQEEGHQGASAASSTDSVK